MHLQNNTLLQGGKYRIEKLIGRDNYNAVYMAIQCQSQQRVIIKERNGEYSSYIRKYFVQEGRLLSKLNHKFIVKCIDFFEENGTEYFVTEFAEGVNLREYQEETSRFETSLRISEKRSITIIKLIAEALDYLHKQGICHLDIKPSNIMFHHVYNEWYSRDMEPDRITLLDFGCARRYDRELHTGDYRYTSGHFAGTPGYAPLELSYPGAKISPATDIYSLGATWYFLLSGHRPPEAGDVVENGGIDDIQGVSPKVNKAIQAAMQPVMRRRPQSVADFLALFGEKLEDSAIDTPKPEYEDKEDVFNAHQQTLSVGTELFGPSYIYVIKKVLGQGGFGITYLASVKLKGLLGTINSDMKVAVKEFYMRDLCMRDNSGSVSFSDSSKGSMSQKYAKKFAKEAIHLSKLNHQNIVRVAESFESNNTSYYVMEYLDGDCLDNYVMNNHGLPEYEAIKYIRQIGAALTYMHSHELLHMDVKPKNVMLKDGRCVLIDFGLAKQYDEHGQPESSTGLGAGTAGYAPLEQMYYSDDKGFAPTIDVYALGATLFKMLTSKTPPPASVVLNEGFDRSELESINVSSDTINVIAMAMEPMKKKRIQTIDEFLNLLPNEDTINQSKNNDHRFSSEITEIIDNQPSSHQYGLEEINGIPVRWNNKASDYQKKIIRQLLGRMTKLCDGRYVLLNDFVNVEEFKVVVSNETFPACLSSQDSAYEKIDTIIRFIMQLNSLTQVIGGFSLMDVRHFYSDDYTFFDDKEDILVTDMEMSMAELIESGKRPVAFKKVSGRKSSSPIRDFDYHFTTFRFKIMIDSSLFYFMFKRPDET